MPLVLIAVALVIVFSVPFFISGRLQGIRSFVSEYVSPSLVRTNDLEAALATDFAARGELAEGSGQSSAAATAAAAAQAAIADDERGLDSLVKHVGIESASLFGAATASIEAWRREEDRFAEQARTKQGATHGTSSTAARARRWEAVELALADLQKLEDELTRILLLQRTTLSHLERLSMLVPTWLVPLALLALAAVGWTARRTILLSQAAAKGQRDAERAMAAKSALMRGVTHDLKNPLGAARGYADLLADEALGPVPDAQAKVIARLRSLLSATLDTVNDLVELSRTDAEGLRIDRRESDFADIAKDCVDDYRAMSDAGGIALQFVVESFPDSKSAVLSTDPLRVRQVLGNMLSNAVKYTPRGGRVQVRISLGNDAEIGAVIACDVSDSGPGIPETLRERVFEEFFRVPATVAVAPGTGVGLAIARRLARLLGGDLRLAETPGGGSTFSLLLPLPRASG